MADSLGTNSFVCVGLASTWGTAVVATQFLPSLSFDDSAVQYRRVQSRVLAGSSMDRASDQGGLDAELSGQTRFRYNLGDLLLRGFFGAFATGTYTYLDSLTGVFLTVASVKGGGTALVTEYDSVKITSLTISSTVDDGTLVDWTGLARRFIDNSVTNTQTILTNLIDNTSQNALHQHWTIWIGDQADALASGDAWIPSEWSIEMTRTMDNTILSQFIEEPVVDDFDTGMISITIPRLTNLQFRTWWSADTPLQARFLATGTGRTKTLTIPNLKVNTWNGSIDGPAHIPQTIDLMIEKGVWALSAQTDVSASTTDDSFNDASNGFPLTFPGAKLYVTGFANQPNNGVFTVLTWTASKIVVTANLTTEAAGPTVNLRAENPAYVLTET